MERASQSEGPETRETTSGNRGLQLLIGAVLGYVVGRWFLHKPALGVALGVLAALVIGSSGDEAR